MSLSTGERRQSSFPETSMQAKVTIKGKLMTILLHHHHEFLDLIYNKIFYLSIIILTHPVYGIPTGRNISGKRDR